MKHRTLSLLLGSLLASAAGAGSTLAAESPLYDQAFEQCQPGETPQEFLVLDGAFAVRQEGNQRFLELPGSPLETYGALFGPAAQDNLAVSARIYGTSKGRRAPAFGLGVNGAGGHRLILSPAKGKLELCLADSPVASTDYTWKTGTWTRFRLQIRPTENQGWMVQGKAWPEGQAEPDAWMIEHALGKPPYAGKPSLWGKPYAGTPIRFDDLAVVAVHP